MLPAVVLRVIACCVTHLYSWILYAARVRLCSVSTNSFCTNSNHALLHTMICFYEVVPDSFILTQKNRLVSYTSTMRDSSYID